MEDFITYSSDTSTLSIEVNYSFNVTLSPSYEADPSCSHFTHEYLQSTALEYSSRYMRVEQPSQQEWAEEWEQTDNL
jgi:hypothetical protein